MKKISLIACMIALSITFASAQGTSGSNIFNHLGVDISASTNGVSFEAAMPITNFLQLRGGVSLMPGVTFNSDATATVDVTGKGNQEFDIDLEGNIKRTQGNVILNLYPFGGNTTFFLAGGAYFGGQTLVGIKAHSDKVAELQQQGALKSGYVEVGDHKVNFESGGNVQAALRTKNLRPYVGIGFGRAVPKHRIGFIFELGCQFTGKLKVCEGVDMKEVPMSELNSDDDFQKIIDKVTVYPVVKFTLTGRIF